MFVKLGIPCGFSSTTADRLSHEVNEARKRNGLPPIEIEGEYCVLCGLVIQVEIGEKLGYVCFKSFSMAYENFK